MILIILSKTRYCVTQLKILASFPTEKRTTMYIYKMSHFPWKNAVSAMHISLVADLMAKTPIHHIGLVMTHKAKAKTL